MKEIEIIREVDESVREIMALIQHTFPAGVFTARDIALIKQKFDRTCEELGVFAEDRVAREALGKALVAAVQRGDVILDEPEAAGETEIICFEGEEIVVPLVRPGH